MRRPLRWTIGLVGLALLAGLATRSVVVVDETEFVLITDFGRTVDVLGDDPGEAGLHGKWPWRSALAVDRRVRVFDPPSREMITGDKRNLEVASYVAWRVGDPRRFVASSGSLESAEARLNERVSAALSSAFGLRDFASLASTDANVWRLDTLTTEVLAAVAPSALRELGVEVLDVRLRRFNHPVEVRPAVFDLIRGERKQVAERLRAEGESQYQRLKSQAERERDAILARAEAEAERIRGKGDAEATRLLNQAHARDPKFYEFVRTLETYRSILDDRATVVLSSSSPLLRLLTRGPADDLLREDSPPPSEKVASPIGAGHEAMGLGHRDRDVLNSGLPRQRLDDGRARRGGRGPSVGSAPARAVDARFALGLAVGRRPRDPAPTRRGPPARVRPD